MATLILTAVGTAIGGPLGGTIGALIGRQADQALFGTRKVSGPRLKDLAVQTSSYGSALPLHFGTMRAAGSVIWSTDLIEHSEEKGGGKGRPGVTRYTYTASFAVALAGRPILNIGRIWADGNLLRGAAGDLKVAGEMRIHNGHGDQGVDPLLAQSEDTHRCPAFRHCAYVVFEDLDLTSFGNRIPSLTFEIEADEGGCSIASICNALLPEVVVDGLDSIRFTGFSADQGSVGDTLAVIDEAIPLACRSEGQALGIHAAEPAILSLDAVPTLPPPAALADKTAGEAPHSGWSRKRDRQPQARQCGLRYYDVARDYQPGLQRNVGRAEHGELTIIELPAALSASEARALANRAGRRLTYASDTISYSVTEIDPAIVPGTLVQLAVANGLWRVEQWEWQKGGVQLELRAAYGANVRYADGPAVDSGRSNAPADIPPCPTALHAFELPWSGSGTATTARIFAATSAATAGWTGAALFVQSNAEAADLTPVGSSGKARSIMGRTITALPPASALLLDTTSTVDVQLIAYDQSIPSVSLRRLLQGANLALVGQELIQFSSALALGGGRWRLGGMARGRAGTEWAVADHHEGEPFVLLGPALTQLDADLIMDSATSTVVALGLGDTTPVEASIASPGATLRPLSPVHGSISIHEDGRIVLSWMRRARGAWSWQDNMDAPLNEETEVYDVIFGDEADPQYRWNTSAPMLEISSSMAAELMTAAASPMFKVRQLGRGVPSFPLTITIPM